MTRKFDIEFAYNMPMPTTCLWLNCRAGGTGGAGGAIAPPIFLKIGGKVALSTPNISWLVSNAL